VNKQRLTVVSCLFFTVAWATMPWFDSSARAQADSFYKGKTIKIVVGSTPGSFYDAWARLVARHWGKYIPGNPEVIVQNMPGAGSLTATNFVYSVAKPLAATLILRPPGFDTLPVRIWIHTMDVGPVPTAALLALVLVTIVALPWLGLILMGRRGIPVGW